MPDQESTGNTNDRPSVPEDHCRLILTVDASVVGHDQVAAAVNAGDVASLIVYSGEKDQGKCAGNIKKIISASQDRDVSALLANDTQMAGRNGADGIFIDSGFGDAQNAIARFSPHKIVGCGGIKDRHQALKAGELQPDFVFFGKLGGDIKIEPHPKNLALAEWWASMIEIPCVLMGGNSIDCVVDCANSGAEFVALGSAVFNQGDAADNVVKANKLLEEFAPRFEQE